MKKAHRRHDISNRTWRTLEPLLPGRKGQWGGVAKNNRLFLNAVFWIIRYLSSIEGFTLRLRRLEKYSSTFLSLKEQRYLEQNIRAINR